MARALIMFWRLMMSSLVLVVLLPGHRCWAGVLL
jgi:hypothetical protein